MPELTASGIDPSLETLRKIEHEEANTWAKAPRSTCAQLAYDYIGIYPNPIRENWEEDQRILDHDVIPFIGDMTPVVSRET